MRSAIFLLTAFLIPAAAYAAQVNINTANAALLETLPRIGPTKAAAIIDYRSANGPFATIEDIQNVKGIGPVTYANLKDSITIGGGMSQPEPAKPSYKTVQKVEPFTSPQTEEHEEAGRAPAAAIEPAAAGAALPTGSRAEGLFSPWTLGLIGVILLASGAFIFL